MLFDNVLSVDQAQPVSNYINCVADQQKEVVEVLPKYETIQYRNFLLFVPRWYALELEDALEEARERIFHLERLGNANFVREAHNMSNNYLKVYELLGEEKAKRIQAEGERDYYKNKYQAFREREARARDINADQREIREQLTVKAPDQQEKDTKFKSSSGLSKIKNCKIAYTMDRNGSNYSEIANLLGVKLSTVDNYIREAKKHVSEVEVREGNTTSYTLLWSDGWENQ